MNDHEVLIIYCGVKYFRPLVEIAEFVIGTNHKPLVSAVSRRDDKATARQIRQLPIICEFSAILSMSAITQTEFQPHYRELIQEQYPAISARGSSSKNRGETANWGTSSLQLIRNWKLRRIVVRHVPGHNKVLHITMRDVTRRSLSCLHCQRSRHVENSFQRIGALDQRFQ